MTDPKSIFYKKYNTILLYKNVKNFSLTKVQYDKIITDIKHAKFENFSITSYMSMNINY